MSESESNTVVDRMTRRREVIQAAREQFSQLSTPSQELLRIEFQRAEDLAREVNYGAARSL